jgi:hypothetical protein
MSWERTLPEPRYEVDDKLGRLFSSTSSTQRNNFWDPMHQPSFDDVNTLRLLGRSHTYKLETIDPIISPIDFNPVPSIWAKQTSGTQILSG